MEQNLQIRRCEINEEQQLLDLEIAGVLPYPIHGERFRISAVFSDGLIDRYFPMIAQGTVCEDGSTQFHAAVNIHLDTVFFEYHPENPDDIILLQFCTCTPDHKWMILDTDMTLHADLFQSHTKSMAGKEFGSLVYSGYRFVKYLIYTILLPVWLLSGYLAWKGHGHLHPAARGRQGKGAIFYHAHGIVLEHTGHGYSIRELKTNYFRRQYEKCCKRYPRTEGILFLSERQVEEGGNLDLIRRALAERRQQKEVQNLMRSESAESAQQERAESQNRMRSESVESVQQERKVNQHQMRSERLGQEQGEEAASVGALREFLVTRPVQKLSWKELRHLADLVAASRLIILEDFYPQLHALSIRPETRILQMWHACGAFKLFGLSDLGISVHLKQDTRNHRSYHAALASGEGIVPFYSEAFGIPSSHIYPVGVPRTDCFFQEEAVRRKKQELYQRYPFLQGKRVLLFAPTFRGSGNQNAYYPFERFPLHQILKELPEDVMLIVKNHPFVHGKLEIAESDRHRILDLTGIENINDLLLITDVLVTDYSSVIFEAAILQIPMLFYVFDLEEYIQSRDLYFDFAGFAPGQIVREWPDLIQAVQNTLESTEHYGSEAFREFFLGAVDGHSTERVLQLVQQLYQDVYPGSEEGIVGL